MSKKLTVQINGKRDVRLNGERLRRKYRTWSSRRIYIGKEYVIKVEWDDVDLGQCKDEYRIWKSLPDKHRKYFAPILKFGKGNGYRYVVCPKLNLKDSNDDNDFVWNSTLRNIAKKYGLVDLTGRLNENWFIVDGKPIIIDYGV